MFDVITIGSAVRDVFARTKDIKAIKDKKFAVGEAADAIRKGFLQAGRRMITV